MRKILLVLLFLGLFASPGFSEEEERVSVLLPYTLGTYIYLVDEEGNKIDYDYPVPEPTEKFAELYVSPRVNPDNPDEFYIPKNLEEAVRELKLMLPPDYLEFVLEKYGYVKSLEEEGIHRPFIEEFDNRELDLSRFLFTIWGLHNLDQTLTKQIDCMGNFEFQMPAIFISLMLQEILDKGGAYTEDMYEAVYLTRRLKIQCLGEEFF